MATPSVLTTTVSGRVCTRSRRISPSAAVTSAAVTSAALPTIIPPESSSLQATSAAAAASSSSSIQPLVSSVLESALSSALVAPPPATPSSTTDTQQASTTAPASTQLPSSRSPSASSNAGTLSFASLLSSPISLLSLQPLSSAPVAFISVAATPSEQITPPNSSVSTLIPASRPPVSSFVSSSKAFETTISDPVDSAVLSSGVSSSPIPSSVVSSEVVLSSVVPSSVVPSTSTLPLPTSSPSSSHSRSSIIPSAAPTAGSAGLISPFRGSGGSGLGVNTGGNTSQIKVGGLIGGIFGGIIGLSIVGALLYMCLQKRQTREKVERWKQHINEKRQPKETQYMVETIRPLDKIKALLASAGSARIAFIGRLSPRKQPTQEEVNRSNFRDSGSSVYSQNTLARSRARSEPASRFRNQFQGFSSRRRNSNKATKGLHRPPFLGNVGNVSGRTSNGNNPFLDPEDFRESMLPNLRVMNPDASRPSTGMLTPRQALAAGLAGQQRAPITPTILKLGSPAETQNPFLSPFDDLADRNTSSTPEWLRRPSHSRTQSAQTALHSNPPSSYEATSSFCFSSSDNPFVDPLEPPLPPDFQPRYPSNDYVLPAPSKSYSLGLGSYPPPNSSRNSQVPSQQENPRIYSSVTTEPFLFGEPGLSRPTTAYTNESSSRATRGKSDPFDLDRPEVLGFGEVGSRKQVRASVTRQTSRSNRQSSTPNWVNMDDEVGPRPNGRIPMPTLLSKAATGPGVAR